MAMKHLLSRSTCSLEGLKQLVLVVPETLTRRFVNSWLAVDDHDIETYAKKQAHNANRDHIHFVCVLDDHIHFLLVVVKQPVCLDCCFRHALVTQFRCIRV